MPQSRRRSLIGRGRRRLGVELRDAADRIIASDPGLSRLRQGVRAAVAVGTTAVVQWGVAAMVGVTGRAALQHIMIGSMVAMTMATQVRETTRPQLLRTALGTPVAAAVGVGVGSLIAPWHLGSLVVFVLVSFLAVWLRRFGSRWFGYGFLCWQTYFFTLFLKLPAAQLPGVLAAVAVSTTWVTLLLLVLHEHPRSRLRRTVTALRARARAVVSAALDVLHDPESDRRVRMLRRQLVKFSENALLFDAQLATTKALPVGASPARLRRWIVDLEIGVDEIANASVDLASRVAADEVLARAGGPVPHPPARPGPPEAGALAAAAAASASGAGGTAGLGVADPSPPDPPVSTATLRAVDRALRALGWGELDAARIAAAELRQEPHRQIVGVRRIAGAAESLVATVDEWLSGRALEPVPTSPDLDVEEPAFAPVVTLISGNLPGSAPVATQAVVHGDAPWWSPTGWSLSTRQAIQAATAAAVAIVAGELISSERYYWAVIAAFVSFIGTATAGETVRKNVARFVGTVAGLLAAVALASVTGDQPGEAIGILLVSVFFAFYFQALSAAATVFFITLMLGELYTLVGAFNDQVLLLRLAETGAGAGAAILVSLLVLPTSTRQTLRVARRALLSKLSELMYVCGLRWRGEDTVEDLLTTALELDAAARQVALSSQAMVLSPLAGGEQRALRHRMAVLAVCASTARSLVPLVRDAPAAESAAVGAPAGAAVGDGAAGNAAVGLAFDALAVEAARLADIPDLRRQQPRPVDDEGIARQVAVLIDGATDVPVVLLRRLLRLADALALLTPRGRG